MRRLVALLAAVAGLAALSGCRENLESDASCPILCPQRDLTVRDTVLDPAVVLDSTLAGYPGLGLEPTLIMASRGDTLDARAIVRFDSLHTDTTVHTVDSAMVVFRLVQPYFKPNVATTIEAYDVDTTATDTLPQTLLPLFRPDRLIGGTTVTLSAIKRDTTDTTLYALRVPISDSAVEAKIQGGARLRIGFVVRAAESQQILVTSVNGGSGPQLKFRAGTDTTFTTVAPSSATPATPSFIAPQLEDYTLVAQQRLATIPPEVLSVGGISGRRAYLRLQIPDAILDSSTVVRAELLLTQQPNPELAAQDTVSLLVQVPSSGAAITDLSRQVSLLSPLYQAELLAQPTSRDSLNVVVGDSGVRTVELTRLFRSWKLLKTPAAQRAIVLRGANESQDPGEIFFSSAEAASPLRPRLRISYVPQGSVGLP